MAKFFIESMHPLQNQKVEVAFPHFMFWFQKVRPLFACLDRSNKEGILEPLLPKTHHFGEDFGVKHMTDESKKQMLLKKMLEEQIAKEKRSMQSHPALKKLEDDQEDHQDHHHHHDQEEVQDEALKFTNFDSFNRLGVGFVMYR
jgi:hypothetical protein